MTFLSAGESVEAIARYCRIEQMLFAVLGRWSAEVTDPNAKLALLSASDHCAWRSKRWFELLPTAPPGPDSFLTSTTAEREWFGLVADRVGDSEGSRMVMTYQLLLPGIHRAMSDHLDRTSPVADAPVQRILAIAMTDVDRDIAAGVGPMEIVLRSPQDRDDAERRDAELASSEPQFWALFKA